MEILNKLGLFILTIAIGILYRRFMDKFDDDLEIRDLYLINQELLGKSKKPILWLPVPKIKNARTWESFYSRTTDNLNIPYMYLTLKSIIAHCGKSFTICIIDDDSFTNLLPNWTPELDKIGDPLREKVRYLGMMQLIYHYGGVLVPPSFLCLRNLEQLCDIQDGGKPFIIENVNYNGESQFAPDPYFIGAPKKCDMIEEYVDYLSRMISNDYTAESIFLNDLSKWCGLRCHNGKMTLIPAINVGVQNMDNKVIITETFFEQRPLNISPNAYGILIPHDQIMKRTSLNWLCYLSKPELLGMDTELSMYFNRVDMTCTQT
jgi:hypothetical protein